MIGTTEDLAVGYHPASAPDYIPAQHSRTCVFEAGTCAKVLLAIVVSACAACGQAGRASAHASSDPESPSTSASGQSASIDSPQAAANRLWAAILTQCGDSYYPVNSPFRFRQPSFPPVVPDRVTEADRLNGFRWRGWAYVTGKVYAICDEGGCGQWYDSEEDVKTKRQDVFLKMEMWNLNGHWHFKEVNFRKPREDDFLKGSGDEIGLDPPTLTSFPGVVDQGLGRTPYTVPLRKQTCAQVPGTPEYERATPSERMTENDKQKAREQRVDEAQPPETESRPILQRSPASKEFKP
jgi:hypothetical protein